MTRTPSGTLGTHFTGENTTLARLLTITKGDGSRLLLTDHDANITVASKALAATGTLTLDPTSGAATASGVLTITMGNNALDTETVTIGAKTYTFQTTLTNVDGNVQIGADRDESLTNLAAAINLSAGAGTKYAAATTAHPDGVIATPPAAATSATLLISQGTGSIIGNMDNQSLAFDAQAEESLPNAATKTSPSGGAVAYIGKNYSADPQRVKRVDLRSAKNWKYWAFTGVSTPGNTFRFTVELRAANTSLPGDPTSGGTLLGSSGVVIGGNTVFGVDNNANLLSVASSDETTLWDYVWVVIRQGLPSAGLYVVGDVKFYEPLVVPTSGSMAVEAGSTGFVGNLIGTTEGLTHGSWAAVTLTGGSDARYNALDTETVVIGGKTYTFQTTLTNVDGHVQIGADGDESLGNLVAAVNLDAGAGTKYAAATTLHPTVSAALSSAADLVATAKTAGTAGNSIATTETLTNGSWTAGNLAGGDNGTYLSDPGFTASASTASTSQGVEGLDVTTPVSASGVTQNDIISGDYDEAQATVEYVNWASPDAGLMTLFAGVMGEVDETDEGELEFTIQGKFTKNRSVRVSAYSPLCRADLGDSECQYNIDQDKQTLTVSTVTSQSEVQTDLTDADDYWKLGIVHWLTGNNAGVAIEVSNSEQTNGVVTFFLPAPLPIQVGDTADIYPGCDKTLATCRDRFFNVVNFRGEPYAVEASALLGAE